MTTSIAFVAGIVVGLIAPFPFTAARDLWRGRSTEGPQRTAARAGEAWGVKKIQPLYPPEPFDAD